MTRNKALNMKKKIKVKELAELVGGRVYGDSDKKVTKTAGIDESSPETLTFAENRRLLQKAINSHAGVIIAGDELDEFKEDELILDNKTYIKVKKPRLAYARAAGLFLPEIFRRKGVSASADISSTAVIGENVSIYPGAVIDEGVKIANNVVVGAGVYIGVDSEVGNNVVLHPNVVIEYQTLIGNDVIIHAGSVIGSDGYGFVPSEEGNEKIPQLGRVIIEDDVEIGANVTVDRGASGPTVIGKGTKIDNLVQIGHNVLIGSNCLIVAHAALAGSCELGNRVTLAGKVGVTGHIKIKDNTTIAAASIITKNIPEGSFYSGNPAHEHSQELKEQALRRKLPELFKKIKRIEKELEFITQKD